MNWFKKVSIITSEQDIWIALAAIAASLLVFVAVLTIILPYIVDWIKRPQIDIDFFNPIHPHLRETKIWEIPRDDPSLRNFICDLYPLSVSITNNGGIPARNAQPHITNMWTNINGIWQPHSHWIPVPIRWSLDELAPIPTQERDLFTKRPYVVNLLGVRSDHLNMFFLETLLMPGGQESTYPPGKYCFEVTVFADRAPTVCYFYITWQKGTNQDFEEVKSRLEIKLSKNSPTSTE